ncbi:beta-ketoacyl-[acyl-carrier-protein] synthase family protein [Butyrivibrio sp. YAB3001]|uniref:beta-ketoacyl-[acyl-carrier-protein] synthase family protein n=1 Tax=Butyrivibrio sp. YAB3001 TaxID=1520812 RepID=UPI0008F67797|nr:beta-ketoacyl-[acyl-carrier-protein] synthase family protein [Butyrivibrio sp. YAB3001]SFC12864.1 3-oxoacyl-[acyl-carrier-protein] synthase II [Butyrivibrio sp. YAB3001]
MKKRIVITGIGVRSSNARDAKDLVTALRELRPGQCKIDLYKTEGLRTDVGCQIKEELKFEKACDERTTAIAFEAIDDLYKDEEIKKMISENKDDIVLSFATSMSGNQNMMRYVDSETPEKDEKFVYIVPDFINKIQQRLGVNGPAYTTMSACAAGSAAAGVAIDEIRRGTTDVAIVGGTDALTLFSTVGFSALKAVAEKECKPFAKDKTGINLGEASAFLVLEELEHAKARNATIYAEVMGYAAKNEAYHITSPRPDGEGAYIVMKEALEDSGVELKDENIYVNAHGTGTGANDQMELKAVTKLFGELPNVYVSSTKAITGHCLGAAGSIELAISALVLKNQFIPGTFRTEDALECEENIKLPLGKSFDHPVDYVLSNSFAFAGNTACVVLKKYQ